MTENELYHYGVLGMRWGKRKNTPAESYYDEKIKKAQPGLDRLSAKSERWQYRKSRDLAEKTGKRQEAGLKITNSVMNRQRNRVDKISNKLETAKSQGNQKMVDHYERRKRSNMAKIVNNEYRSHMQAESVKYLKTRAKQMDSMDIKAGRDYVYSYFSYDIRI